MIKLASILVMGIFFLGCSTTRPAITQFKIQTPNITKVGSGSCKEKSVKVFKAFSDNSFMNENMYYVVGEEEQFAFYKSQWATPLNQQLTLTLTQALSDAGIFLNVQSYKSRASSDYILETNIQDFRQYFNQELNSSYVKIAIQLSLIDPDTNKVLGSKTFSARTNVSEMDAKGGVQSLNELYKKIIEDISIWIGNECNKPE